MYTMYINASNNTPSYTHISSYIIWRVHPSGDGATNVAKFHNNFNDFDDTFSARE